MNNNFVSATRGGLEFGGSWKKLGRLLGALFLIVPAVAGANTEQPITSIFDGQVPYLIVTADKDGGSSRSPGIYYSDRNGEWQELFLGDVLKGRASQGILGQLEITNHTQRYESLVVLDGRLTLIQVPHGEGAKEFTGEIPVRDALTLEKVEIPRMSSYEHLNVHSAVVEDGVQIVLASVKGEAGSKRGMTFAFIVEASGEGVSEVKQGMLLDEKFRSKKELKRLYTDHEFSVYSTRMLRFYSRGKSGEPETVRKWREGLLEIADWIDEGRKADLTTVPRLDLRSGEVGLAKLPEMTITKPGARITQYYDPINGKDEVRWETANGSDFTLLGRVDTGKHGSAVWGSGSHSMAEINGDLYLFAANNSFSQPLKIAKGIKDSKLSFEVRVTDEGLYLFVSRKKKKIGQTDIYFINPNAGDPVIGGRYLLNKTYYKTGLLGHRVIETGGHLYFDDLTPACKSREEYESKFRNTRPLINVDSGFEEAEPKRAFTTPLETLELAEGITFRRFDDEEIKKRHTGITLEIGDQKRVIEAEHLPLRMPDGKKNSLTREVELPSGKKGEITVIAVDRSFQGGANSYNLLVILSAESGYGNREVIDFSEQRFNTSFKDLSSLAVVQGMQARKEHISVLINSEATEEKGSSKGSKEKNSGVLVNWIFRLAKIQGDRLGIEEQNTTVLSRERLSHQDIEKRIYLTEAGELMWLATPELGPKEKKFKLVELWDGEEVLPNNKSGRRVKFNLYSEAKKRYGSEEELFGGTSSSSWRVWYHQAFSEYYQERGYEISEKIENGMEGIFPGLKQFLESLADPKRPAQKQVVLLPEEMKQAFVNLMVHLSNEKGSRHFNFKSSSSLNAFVFNSEESTQKEVLHNMDEIRRTLTRTGSALLIADATEVLSVGLVEGSEKGPDFSLKFGKGRVPPHLLYLLASEGAHIEPSEIKDLTTKIPTLMFATPQEWSKIRKKLKEVGQEGALECFRENTSFYSSNWRLWGPETKGARTEIQRMKDQPILEGELSIIPNLFPTLRELADPKKEAKHRILIVPDELKEFVREIVLSSWATTQNRTERIWTHRNPSLRLEELSLTGGSDEKRRSPQISQLKILRNLSFMRGDLQRRGVLLGDLTEVLRNGKFRGKRSEGGFKISDPADLESGGRPPHALYLIETEGRKVQPTELDSFERKLSVLLVGTEKEYEALTRDVEFEERFGLMNRFEVVRVEVPTHETKVGLLRDILLTPEIRGLRYEYRLNDETKAEEKEKESNEARMEGVLSYLANRSDALAKQFNKDSTSSFLRVLMEFSRSIVEDPSARRSRVVDRNFVERLLSKVYSIPLNLSILPKGDPLVTLSDQNRAALKLQSIGYEGPLELKLRVIKAILAQTKVDPVRKIPSSIIAYGETSTGKTFLFESLCKMLGLQSYDFDGRSNENAQAIKIDFGRVGRAAEFAESPDVMSIERVIAELSNFLTLPRGYRGFILLDDVHKADPKDQRALFNFLNSLHEARDGRIRVMDREGTVQEIPVKNLTIMMTLNPTQDQEMINRYAPNRTDEEMIVASLSSSEFTVEKSMLKRWNLILNLSEFPVGAKAPKLQQSIRESAQNEFNMGGKFVMVSPRAVNRVVREFSDMNARDFLADATNSFLSLANATKDNRVFVVSTRSRNEIHREREEFAGKGRESVEIQPYVSENITAVPVNAGFDGRLQLLGLLLDNFRTSLYETFVRSATSDIRLTGSRAQSMNVLAPLLVSIVGNMGERPELPFRVLNLDPHDFGVTNRVEGTEFAEVLRSYDPETRRFFPIQFSDETGKDGAERYREFREYGYTSNRERTRMDVVTEYSIRLEVSVENYLRSLARAESVEFREDVRSWAKGLTDIDPKEAVAEFGRELTEQYLRFLRDLFSRELVENRYHGDATKGHRFSALENAMLFILALDRAIARQPWGRVSTFFTQMLQTATARMEMGHLAGLQYYLFGSKHSIFKPASHELLLQSASASDAFRKWKIDGDKKISDVLRERRTISRRLPRLLGGAMTCRTAFGGGF